MKISIITILDNNNFGTYLQAFALCKTIERLGHRPELVDYSRPFMTSRSMLWNSLKHAGIHFYKWPARIYRNLKGSKLKKTNHAFLRAYLTDAKYESFQNLLDSPPHADIYMTGSDQVWNSVYNKGIDKSFFLGYAPDNAKRVAYAASIGMPGFPQSEQAETFELLNRYHSISVRENSAKELLIRLGISSDKIFSVIDPTLLLDKMDWGKFIPPRIHDFKYLLLYSVETNERGDVVSSIARRIAEERGLKIVGVYYGHDYFKFKDSEIDHFYSDTSTFLSLMYNADFTVVSSFHGTAFSINFQKEFVTVTPERFNSRVMNLLEITGLTNRLAENENFNTVSLSPIDYKEVSRKLDREKKKSLKYLETALSC